MCWNEDISLNTFLFACFALVFIYIANTYTRYKSTPFENTLTYLFVFLVASMQLLEYFLWRNLKHKSMNTLLSKMGLGLLILQILSLLFMVEGMYRSILFVLFLLYLIAVYLYKSMYSPFVFKTTVSKNGHLSWDWLQFLGYEKIILFVGLLFYTVPAFFLKSVSYSNLVLGGIFFLIAYMVSKNDNTYGSLWCWLVNLLLLKEVIGILLVKPYYEYNGLC